jgi:hypothetical protein
VTVSKRGLLAKKKVVRESTPAESSQANLDRIRFLYDLLPDDEGEAAWLGNLRPQRCLVHPSEAFAQGIKLLRPAIQFNTFDAKKAKERRREHEAQARATYEKKKASQMVPGVGLLNAPNARKIGADGNSKQKSMLNPGSSFLGLASGAKSKKVAKKIQEKKMLKKRKAHQLQKQVVGDEL